MAPIAVYTSRPKYRPVSRGRPLIQTHKISKEYIAVERSKPSMSSSIVVSIKLITIMTGKGNIHVY